MSERRRAAKKQALATFAKGAPRRCPDALRPMRGAIEARDAERFWLEFETLRPVCGPASGPKLTKVWNAYIDAATAAMPATASRVGWRKAEGEDCGWCNSAKGGALCASCYLHYEPWAPSV